MSKPGNHRGQKPPPPIRTGPTRSTFDGCAVTAVALAGGILSVVGGVIYGAVKLVEAAI